MKPLESIKVVELATAVSGPFAGMMLAEMGAEVIKIEPPEGELTRHLGPFVSGHSIYYTGFNRGKTGEFLDLRENDAKNRALSLVSNADVLIENWRPGVAERLGLSFDTLSAMNPKLIHASIKGFPANHTRENERVYDAVIQAAAGVASTQGGPDDPQVIRTIMPDKITAMAVVQAVLAALFERVNTGKGRKIQISMLETTLAFLWPDMMRFHSIEGSRPAPGSDPWQRIAMMLPCAGGRTILLSAVTDEQWTATCRVLQRIDLVVDYPRPEVRIANADKIKSLLASETISWESVRLLGELKAADVPCSDVATPLDLIEDEELSRLGIIKQVERAGIGISSEPPPMVNFNGSDWQPLSDAPAPPNKQENRN